MTKHKGVGDDKMKRQAGDDKALSFPVGARRAVPILKEF